MVNIVSSSIMFHERFLNNYSETTNPKKENRTFTSPLVPKRNCFESPSPWTAEQTSGEYADQHYKLTLKEVKLSYKYRNERTEEAKSSAFKVFASPKSPGITKTFMRKKASIIITKPDYQENSILNTSIWTNLNGHPDLWWEKCWNTAKKVCRRKSVYSFHR